MAKTKIVYICSSCGSSSPKWIGKCPQCEEWNTYQEEVIERPGPGSKADHGPVRKVEPVSLARVEGGVTPRLVTPDTELNRVLGGGVVPGSIILLGGQPGIGKSTLLLQTAMFLPGPVLYVSGEESEEQIRMRADRMLEKKEIHGKEGGTLEQIFILSETNVDIILDVVARLKPKLCIIDSIQTCTVSYLDSVAGSITQVRESAVALQKMSKKDKLPVILIGHITKEGNLAGPKVLEHLVDTVLQFEGDRNYAYRILRTMKNRFGSTDELGIYAMEEGGLRQVHNPSELLLSEKDHQLSGSAVAAMVEGMRPLCIEVQALVSTAVYGVPQRQATGFDTKRMHMLLAVLEKRCGFHFGHNDVFVNIAGGLHVEDPGIDLAVVAACISSLENIPIDPRMCFAGEVGLSGEVRSVSRLEMRIAEAGRLGFTDIWIPKAGFKGTLKSPTGIQVHAIGRVDELYANLFKQ